MSAIGPVAPVEAAGGVRRAGPRIRMLARQFRQAYLQVFGIPDYARYTAHHALHHPGEPLLTEREFAVRAIERKYSHSGPRCC